MDDYLTIFATLLGAIIGGIMALVGAYLVQRQVLRREDIREMRSKIYGPILMELSDILEATRQSEYSDPMRSLKLKEIIKDYLFLKYADQDLKNNLSELIDRIEKYDLFNIASQEIYSSITQKEVKRAFALDIVSGDAYHLSLRLLIGDIVVSIIYLHQAVFLKSNLKEFVKAGKEKWGEDVTVEAFIGSKRTVEDFESLYAHVSQEIEKESLYLKERTQRMRLIEELEHFLEKIKVFV